MRNITSRTNPEIKHIASLHNKKYRTKHNQFIAEGLRVCSALISHNHQPIGLYATQKNLAQAQSIIADEYITVVDEHVMEKISTATTPSGIVGIFHIPQAPKPEQLTQGLVLTQISDPGNMGTLIRTAAALNVSSIVIIEGADPWSPKVVQASAGTIGMVTIFQWSWDQLLQYKADKKLWALVISGGQEPKEIDFQIDFKDTLLVVGSEAHGIPDAWIAACDAKLTLPMPGHAESLNAAVAGSIALYLAAQ